MNETYDRILGLEVKLIIQTTETKNMKNLRKKEERNIQIMYDILKRQAFEFQK